VLGVWLAWFAGPRLGGTFPRFLGTYVREQKLVTWPETTSLPAEIIGLSGIGRIQKGFHGDWGCMGPGTDRKQGGLCRSLYPTRRS